VSANRLGGLQRDQSKFEPAELAGSGGHRARVAVGEPGLCGSRN
jgi:hypothetical protein